METIQLTIEESLLAEMNRATNALQMTPSEFMRVALERALALLGKTGNSPKIPQYDYVLFDCPPSFTLLSYSVLSCCDLILIPVNPDFFASKGTNLILNSLRMRIEPFPLPKIGVFMNKTKTYGNQPTKESAFYMREVAKVCKSEAAKQKIQAQFFETWIPDRVGVKRAITTGGVPSDLVEPFKNLWEEVTQYLA